MSWFLTCFAVGDDYVREMREMLKSFRKHHPHVPAIVAEYPIEDTGDWAKNCNFKAQWCKRVYEAFPELGTMLWADADCRFRRQVCPPDSEDWKVAAKLFDKTDAGLVWFRGDCYELMDKWVEKAQTNLGDGDEDAFQEALDECGIVPRDLPNWVYYPSNLSVHGFSGRLEQDASVVNWKMARKAQGQLEDWPPPEEVRERTKHTCSLEEWWNKAHQENNQRWLTFSDPLSVVRLHQIMIDVRKKYLDIGVGNGSMAMKLSEHGGHVDCLDISKDALKAVRGIAEGIYTDSLDLPHTTYDWILSHLVAQHMSDQDLRRQIGHCVYALKFGGTMSIQVRLWDGKSPRVQDDDLDTACKEGWVARTMEEFEAMVNSVDGHIVKSWKHPEYPWFFAHIKRN